MRAYLEIEIPKDGCTNCPLARRESIFSRICVITGEIVDGNYERGGFPTECPLQELPPHGRLIDADRLGFAMMDAANADQALAMVDAAPTVIPASEEGE